MAVCVTVPRLNNFINLPNRFSLLINTIYTDDRILLLNLNLPHYP